MILPAGGSADFGIGIEKTIQTQYPQTIFGCEFVGDFDRDGTDSIGLHRESTGLVYFRNSHTLGTADEEFIYGNPGDQILAGEWHGGPGGGVDTVGIFRSGTFHLRFTNTPGNADEKIAYGNRSMVPIGGHFGPLPGGDAPPAPDIDILPRSAWGAAPADPSKMTQHTVERLTGVEVSDAGQERDASELSLVELRRGLLLNSTQFGMLAARLPEDAPLDRTAPHANFGDLHCRAWYLFQRIHDTDHVNQCRTIREAPDFPPEAAT